MKKQWMPRKGQRFIPMLKHGSRKGYEDCELEPFRATKREDYRLLATDKTGEVEFEFLTNIWYFAKYYSDGCK